MKRLILLVLTSAALQLHAQSGTPACKPASNIPASWYGVFPESYGAGLPGGEYRDTVCLNGYIEHTFTIKTPPLPALTLPGLQASVKLDSASLNLPKGFGIACDPPTCQFPMGVTGCVVLRGTPTQFTDIGLRAMAISGVIQVGANVILNFPDSIWTAGGKYALFINPEGDVFCKPSNTSELAATKLLMRNTPNPFQGITTVEVNSGIRGRFDFRVYDFTGKIMYREPVQILVGDNRIVFDGTGLPNGIYVFTLTDGITSVSRKMVKSQ